MSASSPALEPIGTDGWLGRRSALVRVVAATVPAVACVVTRDPLTPALVLAGTLLALPLLGVPVRALARRAWPLLLVVALVGLVNALYAGASEGASVLDLGVVELTRGDLVGGLAAALRVGGVALPGVVVAATLEPLDLADELVQRTPVPPRFAYGLLAALRLLPLVAAQWQTLGRAQRARGLDAGRNPVVGLRLVGARVAALLVGAVRRGTRLATSLDSRGLGAPGPRTTARPRRLGRADGVLLLGTSLLTALAVAASVLAASWAPVVSV